MKYFIAATDLYEKGYIDCNGNTRSDYTYLSSEQLKVYEDSGSGEANEITSKCTGWTTTISGTEVSSSGVLSCITNLGHGASGKVCCTYNGVAIESDNISILARSYSFSVPKTNINHNEGLLRLTYDIKGFPGAVIYSNGTESATATWISLNGGPINEGSDAISIAFENNNSYVSRTGKLSLCPGDASGSGYLFDQLFTQAGQNGGAISLSTYELSFFKQAGSETVSVTGISSGQPWTASSNNSWCTISKTSSTGPGNVTISVTPHTGNTAREATVTFTSMGSTAILTVRQGTSNGEPITVYASAEIFAESGPSSSHSTVTLELKNENNFEITISDISFTATYNDFDGNPVTITSLNSRPQMKKTTYSAGETNTISFGHSGMYGGQIVYSYKYSGKTYNITAKW